MTPVLALARTVAAALAALLISASTVHAADLVKFRASVIPITDTAQFYAAMQEGYFAAEGLDVTTSTETTGAVGIPALVAGAYEVVYSNVPSILTAISQGIDLRFVSMGDPSGPPDFAGLVVRKGEGIKAGKDLQGKTIAVNGMKNLQWMFARAWVKATGGDPELVTLRDIPLPQMFDALKNKQADAIFAIDPFLSADLQDPTVEVLGYPFTVVAPKTRVAAWAVSGDFATKHPDLVKKFQNGMAKGAAWVNANRGKEPLFKLVAGFTKMDPARVAQLKMTTALTEVDVADLKRMSQLMLQNGLLSAPLDPTAKVFTAK